MYSDQPCNNCGKIISDDEWVVNWGSCSECFDRHYKRYMFWANLRDFARKLMFWRKPEKDLDFPFE